VSGSGLEADNRARIASPTKVWKQLEKDKSVEEKKNQNRNPGFVL
jgi:hypothetical protein